MPCLHLLKPMAILSIPATFQQHEKQHPYNIYEQWNRNGKKRTKPTLFVKLMPLIDAHITKKSGNEGFRRKVTTKNSGNEGFRRKVTRKPVKNRINVGLWKEAMELLHLTEQPRTWVDSSVYVSLLQTCIDLRAVTEGLRIHAHMIKVGFKPNIYLDNVLLNMYVKFGLMEDARHVFDKMPQRDKVSWTTVITGYSKNGFAEEAVELFCTMLCEEEKPNNVTFLSAVQAITKLEALDLGRQVHGSIIKSEFELSLYLERALVDLYGTCGVLEDAFQVFDRMSERDVIAWTAMIKGCANQGCGKEALRLFCEMQCEGVEPNRFTFASMLKACAELMALIEGQQVHAAIVRNGVRQDVYVGSALIGMYVKCQRVLDARQVFDRMRKHNTVSWTTMIAGYAQTGFGKEAIAHFRAMQRAGMKPNIVTLISILTACAVVKAEKQGKQVHAQIIKNEHELNSYVLNTLVGLYAKCGNRVYADKVFTQIPIPDVVSWSAMIAGHVEQGHSEEALTLLMRMLGAGMNPNQFTFTSILRACADQEALEQGKQIHGYIAKTQFESNAFVRCALMDMYAKCGSRVQAYHVFNKMPKWNVIIRGYLRHGNSREALRLLYEMHKSGIKPEDDIIVNVLNAYACNIVGNMLVSPQNHASDTSLIYSEMNLT